MQEKCEIHNNYYLLRVDVIYLFSFENVKYNTRMSNKRVKKCRKRINIHKFDLNNFSDSTYSRNVAIGFNSECHSIDEFRFLPSDIIVNNFML
jgi:hypothetical protein